MLASTESRNELQLFGESTNTRFSALAQTIIDMRELKYINYDSEIQQLKFTDAGINYLKTHGQAMQKRLQQYDIDLSKIPLNILPRIGFNIGNNGFKKLPILYPVLNVAVKRNELGHTTVDYNSVEFTKKASGEIIE